MRKHNLDTARDALLERLDRTGDCWLWTGPVTTGGYGTLMWTVLAAYPIRAHRAAYMLLVGPIPAGRHVHHLCKQPLCCNPDHLTTITPAQHARLHNPKRETPCIRNHAPNWRVGKRGGRACRDCDRERNLERRRTTSAAPV